MKRPCCAWHLCSGPCSCLCTRATAQRSRTNFAAALRIRLRAPIASALARFAAPRCGRPEREGCVGARARGTQHAAQACGEGCNEAGRHALRRSHTRFFSQTRISDTAGAVGWPAGSTSIQFRRGGEGSVWRGAGGSSGCMQHGVGARGLTPCTGPETEAEWVKKSCHRGCARAPIYIRGS